jgi:hypothetical protein
MNSGYRSQSDSEPDSRCLPDRRMASQPAVTGPLSRTARYEQVVAMVEQSLQPPQIEVCLSPLLWSETFAMRIDG